MNNQVTFLHIPVSLRALYELSARRGWGSKRGFDEGRALHHALGEVFGPKSLQPFRLMVPPGKQDATIYAYSTLTYDDLQKNISISPPDIEDVFICSEIRHKPLSTSFAIGHRLGFDIRIRPIRRVKKDESRKKSEREIDVYQHAAERNGDVEGWHAKNTRESVYRAWLAERLEKAAILESANLTRFQRSIAVRATGIYGPDAVMQGVLNVKDVSAFADVITKGLGRHKTYGYGMLLLRPANREPFKG